MITDTQKAELSKPLDPRHVKPAPKGKYGEYVEGWHVINEANRIFGFDGWSSSTSLEQLGEPVEVDGKWRVNYRAKVIIAALGIIREGSGFGQGIDRDIGQAHESALKEAETDARKRALMTFGYPFGLALYDKTKANVQEPPAPVITDDQVGELMQLLDHLNVPVAEVLKTGKIKSLPELQAARFERVKSWINTRAIELRNEREAA